MEKSSGSAAEELPGVEERRALIQRVAASEHFARSARLRDFLLYVGMQSLKNERAELHEQEIGAKVFGRPESYDRSQDNIVRVNATELRRRIDFYFATEGLKEPLIFEIPRGGYKPVFRWRQEENEESLPVMPEAGEQLHSLRPSAPVEAAPLAVSTSTLHIHMIWGAICLLLALSCVALFEKGRTQGNAGSAWAGKPAVAQFWRGFLRLNQKTDVVLPDDSVSVIEDITHQPISLYDYLSRGYMRQIQSSNLSAERKEDLDQIANHNLLTFGAVRAAQQIIAAVPDPDSHALDLTLTRYYSADQIKRDNFILIGGKKSNPWVHIFDDQMNFITDYDDVHFRAFVRNQKPGAGEESSYSASDAPNSLVGYSVIAFLPNPSHTGNAIVLAGTDSDATSAAAEFLTSEEKLQRFKAMIHSDRFPYFEVLLKTSRVSGTSFNADLVAYRTYPDLR
jgi:hypothetical protein